MNQEQKQGYTQELVIEGLDVLKPKSLNATAATPKMRTTRNVAKVMHDGSKKSNCGIQLSLFDDVPDFVKEKAETNGIKYMGVNLNAAGWRMVEALQKLLYNKSETRNQNDPGYYMGNYHKKEDADIITLPAPIKLIDDNGNIITANPPIIETTITEIASIYYCTRKPSNTQINQTKKALKECAEHNYLFRFR